MLRRRERVVPIHLIRSEFSVTLFVSLKHYETYCSRIAFSYHAQKSSRIIRITNQITLLLIQNIYVNHYAQHEGLNIDGWHA